MGKIYQLSLAILGILLIASVGYAQQPLRWEPSIDAAKQVAARSNRLVLIEFSAPWCGQCRAMETDVFNRPGIAGAIQANYVPVRINVDLAPQTAKQYGITLLPTTVIIASTPRGDVYDSIPGRLEAAAYLTRLNRLAAATKGPPAPTAQIAGGTPPVPEPSGQAAGPSGQARPTGQAGPTAPSPPQPAATAPLGLDGYCPVRLVEKRLWIRGDARWGAIHEGHTYLFAGQDEQRQFLADPNRYAPVHGGNDVVSAVEQKQVVPGGRRHGVTYVGRVYLFADEANLQKFMKNPRYYVEQIAAAGQPRSLAARQSR